MLLSKILIHNNQKDLKLPVRKIRQAISLVLNELNLSTDEVSFHFVSEYAISHLHDALFSDPSPTDCITLPMDPPAAQEEYHILGEAFICPKVALDYASQKGINPYEELFRYIIHCLLHFAGFVDTTPRERQKMRTQENRYLKKLHSFYI